MWQSTQAACSTGVIAKGRRRNSGSGAMRQACRLLRHHCTKPPKLPPPIKRTTRLGLLAWDAEEEMRNRQHIREQQEGMPTVDLDGLDVMANTKIREAIERGDFDNLPGQTFSTYSVPHPMRDVQHGPPSLNLRVLSCLYCFTVCSALSAATRCQIDCPLPTCYTRAHWSRVQAEGSLSETSK